MPASQPREQQVPHAVVHRIHLFFPMKKVKRTSMMTIFVDQFNHFFDMASFDAGGRRSVFSEVRGAPQSLACVRAVRECT